MDSIQTQTFSIRGNDDAVAYIDFCDGEKDHPKDLCMKGEKKEGWINIYEALKERCIGAVYNSKETAMRMKVNEKDVTYITTVRVEWEE